MNPDYYATLGKKEHQNGFKGIDLGDLDAVTTRYHVLVAIGSKDDKETGGNSLRGEWAKRHLLVELDPLPDFLKHTLIDLTLLPFGSFCIQFKFNLLKPFISRDDNQFYIVDNPIVREKVFRYPMVRATAWKGSLRHALWQLGHQEDNEQIQQLFGTAHDEKPDDGKSGRLYFYPTFFTQTSLEVINPHDRERRIGKNPILMESVPANVTGAFTLLYTPLDCIGQNEADTSEQVFKDLELVAKGLEAMFTVCGFGAKTSSGYGVASENVSGKLIINYPDTGDTLPQPQKPAQADGLRQFLVQHPNEDFQLKPNAWRKQHKATTSEREAYKEARAANQMYQEEMTVYHTLLAEWETAEHAPPSPTTECPFTNFAELEQAIEKIMQRSAGGDS